MCAQDDVAALSQCSSSAASLPSAPCQPASADPRPTAGYELLYVELLSTLMLENEAERALSNQVRRLG